MYYSETKVIMGGLAHVPILIFIVNFIKGKFEYLTSVIYSENIIFYPDSTQLLSDAITINEVKQGIEFPQVSNTKSYVNYEPYLDRLEVFQTHDMFNLYSGKANLKGNLLLKPFNTLTKSSCASL